MDEVFGILQKEVRQVFQQLLTRLSVLVDVNIKFQFLVCLRYLEDVPHMPQLVILRFWYCLEITSRDLANKRAFMSDT